MTLLPRPGSRKLASKNIYEVYILNLTSVQDLRGGHSQAGERGRHHGQVQHRVREDQQQEIRQELRNQVIYLAL